MTETTLSGRAKRAQNDEEKRSGKLMCYVTPTLLKDIQDFAFMERKSIANFLASVVEAYINPRRDKLETFRKLSEDI